MGLKIENIIVFEWRGEEAQKTCHALPVDDACKLEHDAKNESIQNYFTRMIMLGLI